MVERLLRKLEVESSILPVGMLFARHLAEAIFMPIEGSQDRLAVSTPPALWTAPFMQANVKLLNALLHLCSCHAMPSCLLLEAFERRQLCQPAANFAHSFFLKLQIPKSYTQDKFHPKGPQQISTPYTISFKTVESQLQKHGDTQCTAQPSSACRSAKAAVTRRALTQSF